MKKYILILVLVVFQNTNAQQKKYGAYERVSIEAGILYPLGNLKNQIDPSVNLGFWLKSKVAVDQSVDLGVNFYIPKKKDSFDFERNDSIFRNIARGFSGMVGARYCKTILLSENKNISLDWFPSLGYAFFMYKSDFLNLKNDLNTVDQKRTNTALSTIHFGQGIKLNIDNVAFQMQYQYTPYSLFYKYLDKDFGSQSLILGIVYKQ
jgi:hypothetical protein